MVVEIALGIVLAVILLALLPVAIWAGIGAVKMVPRLLVFAVAGLLLVGVARLLGGPAVVILLVFLTVLWFQAPKLWAMRNGPVGRLAQQAAGVFMGLLDSKPPYDEIEWWLPRVVVKLIAMGGMAALLMAAIGVLYYSWVEGWAALTGR